MFNSTLCNITYLASDTQSIQSKLLECLLDYLHAQNANFHHVPYVSAALASLVVYNFVITQGRFRHKDVWISPMAIFRDNEYHRLFTGVLYHADEKHLSYNILSFAVKCALLEQRFKPWYLLYMVTIFAVLSSLFCTFLRILSASIKKDRKGLVRGCIGISGVLFALKVVVSDYSKSEEFLYWLELAIIHIHRPESCFTSHLGGILVGVLYKYNILQRLMNFGSLDGYALHGNGTAIGT